MSESKLYYQAGRLIQWSLRPDARPMAETEYRELLDQYLDRLDFRDMVQEFAAGLGLKALGAGALGLVLVPSNASIFELRPADHRQKASANERLIDGLIQVAILATVFPRPQDLDEDPTVARPPISVSDVEEMLRQLCGRLAELSRDEPDLAPEIRASGLYPAWRAYHQRPEVKGTRDDRQHKDATRTMIERGFETLLKQGCFMRVQHKGAPMYRSTWRYQLMVQELSASHIYAAVQALLAVHP